MLYKDCEISEFVFTLSKHILQILSWCDRGVSLKHAHVLESINYTIRELENFDVCSTEHSSEAAQCGCTLSGIWGVQQYNCSCASPMFSLPFLLEWGQLKIYWGMVSA